MLSCVAGVIRSVPKGHSAYKTLGTVTLATKCNITEDVNLQHPCENLKSCTYVAVVLVLWMILAGKIGAQLYWSNVTERLEF
jgi:hypothetical protein